MIDAILTLNIVDGTVLTVLSVLSGASVLYLVLARPSWRWLLIAAAAAAIGAILAVIVIWLVETGFDAFGSPFPRHVHFWVVVAFAAIGLAVVSLWRSRWWRKLIAIVSIALFLVTGAAGVNASIGIDRTLGAFLGISVQKPIDLSRPTATSTTRADVRLADSWVPPADLPSAGKTGTQVIPSTASGFASRPAGIYLPPAALVADPPPLPFMLMLMGQPGDPDPQFVAAAGDRYAAAHGGLAPIVVVADQLGDPSVDPLCLDSARYGNAETFLMHDVVPWAQANLNIMRDKDHWIVAGYSNGGQCAISLAAKYPLVWGNVIDISGEEYPGAETPDSVLADVFEGDQAAYDAEKPLTIMSANSYPDTWAVFTSGELDPGYVATAQKVSQAAEAAGMTVTNYVVPGADHVVTALNGGLDKGFEVLYPRLGLSAAG